MPEHHSSRRARALKQDTARQQRRRDRLKDSGTPTTHVLNRAIAEGLLYYLDAERAKGVPVSQAVILVQDVLVYATQVLSRRTNSTDHYDASAVHKALRARVGVQSASKFRIPPTWPVPADDD